MRKTAMLQALALAVLLYAGAASTLAGRGTQNQTSVTALETVDANALQARASAPSETFAATERK